MPAANPVAVITGASSGIGAEYADRLAERNYDLVLVARRADRLRKLAATLAAKHGIEVRVIEADLTAEAGLTQVEQLLRSDERISLLVNNAGNGKLSSTTDISDADTASTIALNVVAPTRLARAILPAFLKRDAGAIINIASVMAFHALPITTLYSATKSFVLMLSRGLQGELAGTGVRVQAVLPAATATDFYDDSGVPLSALDPASVMTTKNMVDAALAGFDAGEAVTLPSVHDAALWTAYDVARHALFGATQVGTPAPRYARAM
ncbi:SDR family NAD(P)-dependent oxidoreductase [Caballeronia sordidicola]|uniref:NADP-dependent 3-hydroxy acid dehydrogenase YdfG n=1 Tax=Caballeronia sordidicola TaxID=196367 RepID=A0A2C9XV09_CABSO|nr:SDR family oxidoreductase [Caballeronia sordidicola]OTP67927.1 putative short-chain dehydrogenase [Caballeronia sordidicola]